MLEKDLLQGKIKLGEKAYLGVRFIIFIADFTWWFVLTLYYMLFPSLFINVDLFLNPDFNCK